MADVDIIYNWLLANWGKKPVLKKVETLPLEGIPRTIYFVTSRSVFYYCFDNAGSPAFVKIGDPEDLDKFTTDDLAEGSVNKYFDLTSRTKVGYLPDNTADVFEEVATQINNRYTKEEIANLISEIYQNIDYKEAVDSYAILLTTYPSPEESWVVQVNDEDTTYRFDGLDWINIGSITSMPLSTHLIDGKMSKDDKIKLDGLPSQITAQLVKYTPTGENDWDTIPTNVKDALDELVGRVSIEYDFIRVKITNGDLLDIHTTPLSLIPAAPLGYITQITELFASFHAGTVVFNASELTIGFDNEGDLMHIDDLDTLTSQVWIAVPGIGFSALKLKVSDGLSALVVGTGTLDVYFKFHYVKLAIDNLPEIPVG